jgi:hypothetical protein
VSSVNSRLTAQWLLKILPDDHLLVMGLIAALWAELENDLIRHTEDLADMQTNYGWVVMRYMNDWS